ncbi:MoaD/ThiS family protein [Plantactinospora sp. GCM10030261]|uniref:MoaD/ThiS family protein n=1 Tax=Plantactinospora sp. GCM10030261 TaxID=3273420 RepID=UPI00360750E3
MVTVLIPAALRPDSGGERRLDLPVGAGTLAAVLDQLAAGWPRLHRRLRDEQGQLRRYVNIYVDGEDCRRVGGLATPVPADAEVQILPSVAGGSG